MELLIYSLVAGINHFPSEVGWLLAAMVGGTVVNGDGDAATTD